MATSNQTLVIQFEKNFSEEAFGKWMTKNWCLSIYFAAVYVLVIFIGKHYMKSRPRFNLRPALVLWNTTLAIFSILGAAYSVPEAVFVVQNHGWAFSICDPCYPGFWGCLFALSKVYELGDTAFIILRKQPLIFLHWYHHVTVLIYCWYSYGELLGPGRWFMAVNYSIHAVMYSYYTTRAMRISLPKVVPLTITIMQILQVT